MNGRGGVVRFFLFLFLSVVVLLQILSMVQSDRFYRALNQLDEIFKGAGTVGIEKSGAKSASERQEEYPGDEGDWLIWAFRVEPQTLNQINVDTCIYSKWITIPYIFEPLLAYDFDEVKLKSWLAESYEVSDGGKEITFRLRDDIHFSDGVPITADDVVFTYETIMNPLVDASNLAQKFVDIEKVVKVDERVVKFYMKRPYFKSLETCALTWDIGIHPKHIYQFDDAEEFNKRVSNPIGSGPFVFEKWDVGSKIVLRRNENYWGAKPKLEKIVFKFITNASACLQALRSHEIDLMIPQPEQFADLVEDEEFNKEFRCLSYWTPWTPFYYMGWNMDKVFFKDRRVRLALTHVVNRKYIVDYLLKGHAEMISSPFYIKGPDNNPDIEPWPYDLQKARELLDEAGWVDSDGDGIRDKDGVALRFNFTYSADSDLYQRLAKLFKDDAAKAGIEVVPEPYEWSVLLPKLSDREFDSMVMGWGGDILEDPYQIFHSSQIGNRACNYVGFRNAEADILMERARATLDEKERTKIFHRLHKILHEEQPYTFLFTRPTFRLVDKRFKNVKVYKLGLKYWEWYVPKAEQRYK
jgi:peptide/nickel transport system substrate-binding protein